MYPTLQKLGGKIRGGIVWDTQELATFMQSVVSENIKDLSDKKYKIVSLGDCCFTRHILTWTGIKPQKANGEASHPFDLCSNNLNNISDCIENNFKDFCEPSFIKNNTHEIYGGSYPHEEGEMSENDAIKFRVRYLRRIANFYEDIYSQNTIFFVNTNHYSQEQIGTMSEKIIKVLSNKFKNINYRFIMTNECGTNSPICFDGEKNIYINHDIPYPEYKWHDKNYLHTDAGVEHACAFAFKIKEIIKKYA
jgi:hypothetical protein